LAIKPKLSTAKNSYAKHTQKTRAIYSSTQMRFEDFYQKKHYIHCWKLAKYHLYTETLFGSI